MVYDVGTTTQLAYIDIDICVVYWSKQAGKQKRDAMAYYSTTWLTHVKTRMHLDINLGGAKGKTKARLANRGWFDDLTHI